MVTGSFEKGAMTGYFRKLKDETAVDFLIINQTCRYFRESRKFREREGLLPYPCQKVEREGCTRGQAVDPRFPREPNVIWVGGGDP